MLESKLLKILLHDKKTFVKMINNPNLRDYFINKYNKFIIQLIVEFYNNYECIPEPEYVIEQINSQYPHQQVKQTLIDHFNYILTIELQQGEIDFILDNFKERVKENIIHNVSSKLDKLNSSELLQNLNKIGELSETSIAYQSRNLWDKVQNLTREIIPTGIDLIDDCGISKGELGILLAGTGIGKSVALSYMANNFMLSGYKVLHIVFEGNIDNYLDSHQRKLNMTNEQIKDLESSKNLKLIKLPSNSTSISDIQKLLVELSNDGFTTDVMVIDYLDCVVGNGSKEIWQNDISIINEMERLALKYNIAVWSAVQANRSGLNKELQLENISGSISKAQKATLIIALRRTAEQQENNQATLSMLKNRFGTLKESVNCDWNPVTMEIYAPITPQIYL